MKLPGIQKNPTFQLTAIFVCFCTVSLGAELLASPQTQRGKNWSYLLNHNEIHGAWTNSKNLQILVQIANLSGVPIGSDHSVSKATVQLLQATSNIKELGCVDKRNSSLKYFPSAHMWWEEEPTPSKFCEYSACLFFTTASISSIYTQWWPHSLAQWINMRGKKSSILVVYLSAFGLI